MPVGNGGPAEPAVGGIQVPGDGGGATGLGAMVEPGLNTAEPGIGVDTGAGRGGGVRGGAPNGGRIGPGRGIGEGAIGGGVGAGRGCQGGGVCTGGIGVASTAAPESDRVLTSRASRSALPSAETNAPAVGYRAAGSFANWRSIACSTAAVSSARIDRSEGGGV